MSTLFNCCVHQKRRISVTGVQEQSFWSGGQGAKPPEAETDLAFGHSVKAANLPAFLMFENAKKITRGALQKWRLISHTVACVWLPEGTSSSSKFLLGEQRGGQGHGWQLPPSQCPLHFFLSGAAHGSLVSVCIFSLRASFICAFGLYGNRRRM